MIVVKLMGGLGNQMFQYAAAKRLAHFHNTDVKLDLSFFEKSKPGITPRSLVLQKTSIIILPATRCEILLFAGFPKSYVGRLFTKMLRLTCLKRPRPTSFIEPHFHFAPEVLDLPDNTYLEGYWQSPSYFDEIADIIQREFTVTHCLKGINLETLHLIERSESVSIHIRRGDYTTNPNAMKFHGTCGIDYYQKCVVQIAEKVTNPHFFVFSDDPLWVRANLDFKHSTTIIDNNDQEHGYEDLMLMSLCKHNIIANSTFSWWGAWLNRNPGKIVMAPSCWFANHEINTKDLLPESWLKVAT